MNFKASYFCISFLLCFFMCVRRSSTEDRQSSSCFINCVNTFHVTLEDSLPEYQTIDKLHGLLLRSFIREADEEELQQFCSEIYQPFLICMTKCPKSLGRDWGIWDYRALSHICMDHLEGIKGGMSCLHRASDDTEQECKEQMKNHKLYFEHVQGYLDEGLHEEQAGERIRNLLDNFCPTITSLMNCERPILENQCTEDFTKNEVDLFYMYLGTVQSRLYAAKLMNYYPDSCKTIYDQYFFGAPKVFNPPESFRKEETTSSPATSSSSSQCFTNCVSEFHVRTELNAPSYSKMDELHDLDLRQFVRQCDPNELDNYCKSIYAPFLTCIAKCPKSVGRDWGIWDYKSLTSICFDNLEDYKSNLNCIKRLEENTVCRNEQAHHKTSLDEIERGLINPTVTIENKLQEFCRTLDAMLQCEHPIEIKECGMHMTLVEQDLHVMYLGQIQSRLHNAQMDQAFPENCQKTYQHLLEPAHGAGIGPTPEQTKTSAQCVRECVLQYRNITGKSDLYRFNHIDGEHGLDLRRFLRVSYSEELRHYCEAAYKPFMICLTTCPKSVGRDTTTWDYIALTHICIDHLDDFADNLVCLRGVGEKYICQNESYEYSTVFNDLQVAADYHLYETNSGSRLQNLLNIYCTKLNNLIACEQPTLSQECSEYVANLEHNILVMYLATVKGRMVNANLGEYFPLNCSDLYGRLAIVPPTSTLSVSGTQRFQGLTITLFLVFIINLYFLF